jgi:hypothetical protein
MSEAVSSGSNMVLTVSASLPAVVSGQRTLGIGFIHTTERSFFCAAARKFVVRSTRR